MVNDTQQTVLTAGVGRAAMLNERPNIVVFGTAKNKLLPLNTPTSQPTAP